MKYVLLISIVLICVLMPAAFVLGEDGFVPLERLPGIDYESKNPGDFFNGLFRYGVIAAAFLATIMLVVAGFEYMTTESVSGKSGAKEKIVAALSGLFLILLSALILQVINPDILQFRLLPPVSSEESSAPAQTTNTFTYCTESPVAGRDRCSNQSNWSTSPKFKSPEECRKFQEEFAKTKKVTACN